MVTCGNRECGKNHSSTRRTLCKQCFDASNGANNPPTQQQGTSQQSINLQELLLQTSDSAETGDATAASTLNQADLPELPPNWLNEPIQNLNGGHILKLILLGNNSQNAKIEDVSSRVEELENSKAIQDPIIASNTESANANTEKIEGLEKTIVMLKKVIVNQQKYMEQLQRSQLANNMMISGIPDTPLVLEDAEKNTTEEKVEAILHELNHDLSADDYTVKIFDPYTKLDGTITHSAKVTFKCVDTKKATLTNAKSFKEKEDQFFKSVYCKNDETKLARDENYRLRKKAKAIREEFPREDVKIEKGILRRNGTQVDAFDLNNQLFH